MNRARLAAVAVVSVVLAVVLMGWPSTGEVSVAPETPDAPVVSATSAPEVVGPDDDVPLDPRLSETTRGVLDGSFWSTVGGPLPDIEEVLDNGLVGAHVVGATTSMTRPKLPYGTSYGTRYMERLLVRTRKEGEELRLAIEAVRADLELPGLHPTLAAKVEEQLQILELTHETYHPREILIVEAALERAWRRDEEDGVEVVLRRRVDWFSIKIDAMWR